MPMPAHAPSEKIRGIISAGVACGVSQDNLARIAGIDKRTLRKYYKDELDLARENLLLNNTVTIVQAAKSGNVVAAIYLQKCLGGPEWREKQDVTLSGGFTVVAARADQWAAQPSVPLVEVTP